MRALVTGDRGFIGNHMVEELKSRDWEVYGCDILDGEDAIDYFRDDAWDMHFDLVVHCAYVVGGRAMIDGQVGAYMGGAKILPLAQNLLLDSSMFNWALRTHQGAVLYFSSSAAYPIHHQLKNYVNDWCYPLLHEDDINHSDPWVPKIPDSDYGWAKLTGERVASAFAQNNGRVHIVRPFSGYGSDQSLDYPFPSIVKRAKTGDLTVWGPPGQTRDWIHIDDVVKGALAVYEQDVREPVNLCTGIGTEMGELARLSWNVATDHGYYGMPMSNTSPAVRPVVKYLEDKPTGVFYRVGDPTKFHQIYQPKISIEEGVREAIGKTRTT